MNQQDIKELVRAKYSEIALQEKDVNMSSCCGSGNCSTEVSNIMSDDYSEVDGYRSEADLGLGCGLPTQYAWIEPGNTVLDLGSGAGNDCFIARHETGAQGKVIGIDFSEAMISKARRNAEKLGFNNVEFRQGDIENMPISDDSVDVVVSNCVLNLVPDKARVFSEIYRVLKPGGHFSISDVVRLGDLPDAIMKDAEMYAGCVAGAIPIDDYIRHIEDAGFSEPRIVKIKPIYLPGDILSKYLSPKEIEEFLEGDSGLFSVTSFAQKTPDGMDASQASHHIREMKGSDICCGGGGGCGCS
jgi:arsenite methyltransferase